MRSTARLAVLGATIAAGAAATAVGAGPATAAGPCNPPSVPHAHVQFLTAIRISCGEATRLATPLIASGTRPDGYTCVWRSAPEGYHHFACFAGGTPFNEGGRGFDVAYRPPR